MNYLENNGIYNLGVKRFAVTGYFDDYDGTYLWTYAEVGSDGQKVSKGLNGAFKTDKCPYMSEIFDKLMEVVHDARNNA